PLSVRFLVQSWPCLRRNALLCPARFPHVLGCTHVTPGLSPVPRTPLPRQLFQWLGLTAAGTPLEHVRGAVAPSGMCFRLAVRFLVESRPVAFRDAFLCPCRFPVALGFAHVATRAPPVTFALVHRELFQHLDFAALRTPLGQRPLALVESGHGVSFGVFLLTVHQCVHCLVELRDATVVVQHNVRTLHWDACL